MDNRLGFPRSFILEALVIQSPNPADMQKDRCELFQEFRTAARNTP